MVAKLPPHDIEAEEAVLGAVLINPQTRLELPFVRADDFYIVRNEWVWTAFERLAARGQSLDYLTVISELRAMGKLDEVGGPAYLTGLLNNTPTWLHAEAYARIVVGHAQRRRLLDAAGAIARLAHDTDRDIDAVRSGAQAALAAALEARAGEALEAYRSIMAREYDHLERMVTQGAAPNVVMTGFEDLDRLLRGLQPGDLHLLAARPSMGKSALLLNMAENMARAGRRVAFFSLEMSKRQLAQRSLAAAAGVASSALRDGRVSDAEWVRVAGCFDRLAALPLYVNDESGHTPLTIRAACQRLQATEGLDAVCIDYLGLLESGLRGSKLDNAVAEVTAISNGLQRLARELDRPVIVAAQLNRAVEQRQRKQPQLSDLRQSGALEQDADVVMFLYREAYYDEDGAARNAPGVVEVIVAKNRNGAIGSVELWFDPALTRFAPVEWRNRPERGELL